MYAAFAELLAQSPRCLAGPRKQDHAGYRLVQSTDHAQVDVSWFLVALFDGSSSGFEQAVIAGGGSLRDHTGWLVDSQQVVVLVQNPQVAVHRAKVGGRLMGWCVQCALACSRNAPLPLRSIRVTLASIYPARPTFYTPPVL